MKHTWVHTHTYVHTCTCTYAQTYTHTYVYYVFTLCIPDIVLSFLPLPLPLALLLPPPLLPPPPPSPLPLPLPLLLLQPMRMAYGVRCGPDTKGRTRSSFSPPLWTVPSRHGDGQSEAFTTVSCNRRACCVDSTPKTAWLIIKYTSNMM